VYVSKHAMFSEKEFILKKSSKRKIELEEVQET
jgi:hypothetical protein